jgi:Uma2 family endonuclease
MGLAVLRNEDLPHYTYDDYVRWEGRWEIINGIPYAMVPAPAFKHQVISNNIAAQLFWLLKDCKKCTAVLPVDWQISEDTVVQPDNLVVCGKITDDKKLSIPPVLVFEVLSPSTVRKDRVLKYQLYREAGLKYYCIVDTDTNSADIFALQGGEYEKIEDSPDGKIFFDLGPCSIVFDFNEVFENI